MKKASQLTHVSLGSSTEGKRKRLLTAFSTPLVLFDRKSLMLKKFAFFRNCYQRFITNRKKTLEDLGIRQVGL